MEARSNVDELYVVARLYYVEARSQEDIAAQLGVSRSKVSRLLTAAREAGIVRISVQSPPESTKLGETLRGTLGLSGVHVVPTSPGTAEPWPLLASALSDALSASPPRAGDVVLASWGRTIWATTAHPLPRFPGVKVAATGAGHPERPWRTDAPNQPDESIEANNIVRQLAVGLQGVPYYLHAPAYPTGALRRELLRDDATQRTLRLWDEAAISIVSIGAPPHLAPYYGPASYSTDAEELAQAAGHVASRYFTLDGKPLSYKGEEDILAISREQLLRVPRRIAVALGPTKIDAILGAARAHLINVLITDNSTAAAVLETAIGAAPVDRSSA
jgi:DNA-binding transcriptional regulator LsrR (DeoR family)